MNLLMIMLTFTVYLQLRRESYNSVTFSLHLLSRIAAFHQYIYFFYSAFPLTLPITAKRCLLSTTWPVENPKALFSR